MLAALLAAREVSDGDLGLVLLILAIVGFAVALYLAYVSNYVGAVVAAVIAAVILVLAT